MNEPDQLLIQLAVIEESEWIESFSIESGILILDRILGRWHRTSEKEQVSKERSSSMISMAQLAQI